MIFDLQVTSFEPYTSLRRTVRWTPCVSRHQSWLIIKLTFACVASYYSARLSTLSGQFWHKQWCIYVSVLDWLLCIDWCQMGWSSLSFMTARGEKISSRKRFDFKNTYKLFIKELKIYTKSCILIRITSFQNHFTHIIINLFSVVYFRVQYQYFFYLYGSVIFCMF